MFCRDQLRGLAEGWNGEGASARRTTTTTTTTEPTSASAGLSAGVDHDVPFEPEWKRVQPTDKELRAWTTWMWLKEGWVWNISTGQRTRASEELMQRARGGGIVREEREAECLIVEGVGVALANNDDDDSFGRRKVTRY